MDNPDLLRMLKLASQGFQCAQILMILGLEADDEENQGLIRALGGLNVGLSDTSGPCGALTGGCCLISYFTGKGDELEIAEDNYTSMLSEYTSWFKQTHGHQLCIELLGGHIRNMNEICPAIVENSYLKAMEILTDNGVL